MLRRQFYGFLALIEPFTAISKGIIVEEGNGGGMKN
jgi:hypothetical protein